MGGVQVAADAEPRRRSTASLATPRCCVMVGTDAAGKTLADLSPTAVTAPPAAGVHAPRPAGCRSQRRHRARPRRRARCTSAARRGPLVAEALDERDHRRPSPSSSRDDVGVGVTGDHDDRPPGRGGELAHAADDLAVEALGVEVALAGDDDVGRGEALVEVELVGDELEAGHEPAAERGEPAGQAAGRAAAVERGDVDAVARRGNAGRAASGGP